jgi:hypothetical protein
MSVETLALIAGAVLSLAFSFIPGLKAWFDTIEPDWKRVIMLAVLAVTCIALFGLSCAGWLEGLWPGLGITCDKAGIQGLIRIFILAAIANQGTYSLTPRRK